VHSDFPNALYLLVSYAFYFLFSLFVMCDDLNFRNVGYKNTVYFDSSVASYQKVVNLFIQSVSEFRRAVTMILLSFLQGTEHSFSPFTQRGKLEVEHPNGNKQCQVVFPFFLATSYRLLADEMAREVQRLAGHGSRLYDFMSSNIHT
jgi:hypothetical protein